MLDIFMLVLVIVLAVVLLVINIYMLAYYVASDDNEFGAGTFCKIFAVLGMLISWGQILLLPLDVSNTRGDGGNFRMDIVWKVIYIVIAVFVFFIIPLLISFYECDPEWTCGKKVANGLCFFFVEVVVVLALFGILYLFFHTAKIPIKKSECKIAEYKISDEITDNFDYETYEKSNCENQDTQLKITVGFPIYAIALLSFISYILFSVFGGVGLFALPLDMIYSYCTRPIKMGEAKIAEMKKEIVETAADLKDMALQVKQLEEKGDNLKAFFTKEKRFYNERLNELKVAVNVMDDQYQLINIQNLIADDYVIKYYLSLIGGIFAIIISIVWVLQIVLYIVIKNSDGVPFCKLLNILLVYLTENNLHFLAIGIFMVFSFYLLLCTLKGNLKFGLRMFCLGAIHPMKKNGTYMNSYLFNVMLSMLTSVSLMQFCVKAFNEYASMTEIDVIFTTQIQYLDVFIFFFKYNVFEYILLGISVISLIYLLLRPNDTNTMRKIIYKKFDERPDKIKAKSNPNGEKLIEMKNVKKDDIDDD